MTTANQPSAGPRPGQNRLPHRVNDAVLETNPLHRYCADPNLAIFDGRYFLYCTDDGVDDWGTTVFSVYVSDDLATWERHPALDLRDVPWWNGDDGAWAPSIVRTRAGRYVLTFVAGSEIGAAASDTPYGPFRAMGHPMVRRGEYHCHTIDPSTFVDDDGTRYFLWGNGRACLAPYMDDCLDFDHDHVISWVPGNFREAIWLHRRRGVYYASWSENDARDPRYCVKYAMGDSLAGPWSEPRTLVRQDEARHLFATGHHSIVNIPGTDEWIMAYHRFAYNAHGRWGGGDGCHREVVFAPLRYADDGSMLPVTPEVGSYTRSLAF